MIAEDRFIVDQNRKVDRERRKSSTNLQSIAFEQKQLEKRLSSLHNLRHRSASEINLHQANESSTNSNQNLLSLPKMNSFQRQFSAPSLDGDSTENVIFTHDFDSSEDDYPKSQKEIRVRPPPIVAIIPPDEENNSDVLE